MYFRDVKFMVQAVLLVWLYVTPIVYPPSALGRAAPWLDFNPLTGIVGLFQRATVGAPVPTGRALRRVRGDHDRARRRRGRRPTAATTGCSWTCCEPA